MTGFLSDTRCSTISVAAPWGQQVALARVSTVDTQPPQNEAPIRQGQYWYLRHPWELTGWPDATHASSTVGNSLANLFVSQLPADPRVERVYWDYDGQTLKVWTVIDLPDDEIEGPIYDAQLAFMDKLSDLECDFTVIYRFGKPIESVWPTGAKVLRLRA